MQLSNTASRKIVMNMLEKTTCVLKEKYGSKELIILVTFISGILWGIFSHGFWMTQNIALFDDLLYMFNVGTTVEAGRWGLFIIEKCNDYLFLGNYALPLYNTIMSVVFLSIASTVIVLLFEINTWHLAILISGMVVTFPTIALTQVYTFTALYYCLAIMLGTAGVYLVCKKNGVFWLLLSGIIIAFMIGIYQAYLPFIITLSVLYLFYYEYKNGNNLFSLSIIIIKQLFSFSLSFLLYCLIKKIFETIYKTAVIYTGDIGVAIIEFLQNVKYRVKISYIYFLRPENTLESNRNIYISGGLRLGYYIALIMAVILGGYLLAGLIHEKKYSKFIVCLLILALFPVCANSYYVIFNVWYIYGLLTYSNVCIYLLDAIMMCIALNKRETKVRYIYPAFVITIFFSIMLFAKFDNILYFKANYIQEEICAYYNVLIARIEGIEGYDDSLPITFINAQSKAANTIPRVEEFELFSFFPVEYDVVFNDNSWIEFMKYHNGYSPEIIGENTFLKDHNIVDMPHYPDTGSIEIIDNTIVVNF